MNSAHGDNLTPSSLGYAMPAEWAPHRATWLSWPHNRETWPTQLERVQEIWLQMVVALAPHERVCLLVNDAQTESAVAARLKARARGHEKRLTAAHCHRGRVDA